MNSYIILRNYLIARPAHPFHLLDDTSAATTVAVMSDDSWEYRYGRGPQGGVWKQKRIFLQIRSNTPPVVMASVAEVGVSSHGNVLTVISRL
jgi:hypothetical protein